MGQSLSDVFYPDNPKRRARAEQLKTDIDIDALSFKLLQQTMENTINGLKGKLDAFLNEKGYNSPEQLDNAVQSVLTGNALSEYLAYKAQYNKQSETESTIFSITSIITVVSGVFLGGLVVLGFMTGKVALGLVGVIGALALVTALVLVLFAVFEGAKERANMREAIRKLGEERVRVRKALKELRALSSWLFKINNWLTDPIYLEFPQIVENELTAHFYNDFAEADTNVVVRELQDEDRNRGSWTNEDGNWAYQSYSSDAQYNVDLNTPHTKILVGLGQGRSTNYEFTLVECTKDTALLEDQLGGRWSLIYDSIELDPQGGGSEVWSKYLFNVINETTAEILSDLKVRSVLDSI